MSFSLASRSRNVRRFGCMCSGRGLICFVNGARAGWGTNFGLGDTSFDLFGGEFSGFSDAWIKRDAEWLDHFQAFGISNSGHCLQQPDGGFRLVIFLLEKWV